MKTMPCHCKKFKPECESGLTNVFSSSIQGEGAAWLDVSDFVLAFKFSIDYVTTTLVNLTMSDNVLHARS